MAISTQNSAILRRPSRIVLGVDMIGWKGQSMVIVASSIICFLSLRVLQRLIVNGRRQKLDWYPHVRIGWPIRRMPEILTIIVGAWRLQCFNTRQ